MADIKSFPNNQDVYTGAEYVMKWLHGRTSGVFAADRNAAVTAVTGKMAVNVSDGSGWIANAKNDGIAWWIDNEKETGKKLELNIDLAESVLGRIDRVVVTWQTTDYVALPTVTILKGASSSAPVPPALTNNNSKRQISLAQISVPAGVTKITADLITDERLNSEVCGIVTDSLIIDTSVIQAQFNAYLEQLRQDIEDIMVNVVPDGSISSKKIAHEAVIEDKIAPNAVTEAKMKDNSVSENKILANAVTTNKIHKLAVTEEKLAGDSVTEGKIKKNSVSEKHTATVLVSAWVNKGSYFEAVVDTAGADPKYPFIIDLNLDSSTYGILNDLEADFGLIFDAKCELMGKLILRAKKKPLKNLPVKILKIKR